LMLHKAPKMSLGWYSQNKLRTINSHYIGKEAIVTFYVKLL
jgi:hypothetical protein